jgi:hypothetical protein
MPMKGDSPDLRVVGRFEDGLTWQAYPDEEMQRASHALAVDGKAWVVDPVDAPGVDDLLAEVGAEGVAGVVVGLDRHRRDAATVARRHDAPVYVPDWMSGVVDEVGDVDVERFGRALADTGYEALTIRDSSVPPWQEVGLFDGETLVVPEAVGTAPYYVAAGERLGVHPMLRPFPPRRAFSGLDPERVLVGHGAPVLSGATAALRDALANARRNLPAAYAKAFRRLVS